MELDRKDILFFVGIKHSGKTTFARRVAKKLGRKFADVDDMVLPYLDGKTVRDFYLTNGKEAFMESEKKALELYLNELDGPAVISLGGGAGENKELMKLIKDNGIIVYLKRDEEDILPVILKDGVPAFLDPHNVEESFHQVYKLRDSIYRQESDVTVDLGPYRDMDETEDFILEVLELNSYGI